MMNPDDFDGCGDEPCSGMDNFMDDADALASAGWGMDEDYGDWGVDYGE